MEGSNVLYPCEECYRKGQNNNFTENELRLVQTCDGRKILVCYNHYLDLKQEAQHFRNRQRMIQQYEDLKRSKNLEIV